MNREGSEMRILIAYGSTEGQTRKIAQGIAEHLHNRQADVEVVDCSDLNTDFDIAPFDAAIIAASVHQLQHQADVVDFVVKHRSWLEDKPTAFVSVSLSAAFDEDKAEAQLYIDQFIDETGWQPQLTASVAGALRYKEYDFMRLWTMRYMAGAKGAPTDTSKDHEFTDWVQLYGFADQFADVVEAKQIECA